VMNIQVVVLWHATPYSDVSDDSGAKLKMEAARSSEKLVSCHIPTRCYDS